MKRTLEPLVAKHQMTDIVETLARISEAQAKRAKRAKQVTGSALWKCNGVELSMTAGSLYHTDLPDRSA